MTGTGDKRRYTAVGKVCSSKHTNPARPGYPGETTMTKFAALALAAIIAFAAATPAHAARCSACGTEYKGTGMNGVAAGAAGQVTNIQLTD
jgi:hypothetical protein